MSNLSTYIIIGLLTVLMGLGAFWQHTRIESLTKEKETLVEANRGLAKAASQAQSVSKAKDDTSNKVTELILDNQRKTQQQVQELASAVKKGTKDEKALMSANLSPDVISVLDSAYKDGNKSGVDAR